MQIQAAHEQLAEVKNVLSRSMTTFSSSCPDPSFLRPPFGLHGGMGFNPMTSPPQQTLTPEKEEEEIEARMSELGQSPTIFSLLQGTSAPSSRATSFYNAAPPTLASVSRGNSVFNNRSSDVYGPDIPEDDLLFSISLDPHDNDSYLADSTQDYLHLW